MSSEHDDALRELAAMARRDDREGDCGCGPGATARSTPKRAPWSAFSPGASAREMDLLLGEGELALAMIEREEPVAADEDLSLETAEIELEALGEEDEPSFRNLLALVERYPGLKITFSY